MGDQRVAQVKRVIDGYNQNRNDWIEKIDDAITDHLQTHNVVAADDAPLNTDDLMKSIEHMGSDELLLFSTDYPHWQFDNDEVLPKGLPSDLMQKIMIDNPLSTYARLREAV